MGDRDAFGRFGADQCLGDTMNTADGFDFVGHPIRRTSTPAAIPDPIGLAVILTIPVVWQFLQPNDDDFGDLTRRK